MIGPVSWIRELVVASRRWLFGSGGYFVSPKGYFGQDFVLLEVE